MVYFEDVWYDCTDKWVVIQAISLRAGLLLSVGYSNNMDQVVLTSSVLDLLQSILMLPLTLLAYLGWVMEKTLSCDGSVRLLTALAVLGIPVGVLYDGFAGVIVLLGATVEIFIVALFCALPDFSPNLLEVSMLAVNPEVLLAALTNT